MGETNINNKSQLVYEGKVTIVSKTKTGRNRVRTFKNNGGQGLFKFIFYSLASRIAEQNMYRPYSIMGYTEAGQECFTTPITYKSTPTLDNFTSQSASVTFTFHIPYYLIEPEKSVKRLKLQNQVDSASTDSICAEADIDTNLLRNDSGSTVILYWTLSFFNN